MELSETLKCYHCTMEGVLFVTHLYPLSAPIYIERERERQRQRDRETETETETEREAERVGYTEGGTLRRLLLSSNYRSWLR